MDCVFGDEEMKWMQMNKLPPLTISQRYPLPNRMSIETSSACNRACRFCPQSLPNVREHANVLMNDGLFDKVVKQIPPTVKCIELFRLNEPLLDHNYLRRIEAIRAAHPKVTTYCATNGDMLYKSKDPITMMCELQRAGLNVISIDVYERSRYKFFKELRLKLIKYRMFEITKNRYQAHSVSKLHIAIARIGEGLTSSWTNCDMKDIVAPQRRCPRPMRHFVVLYNGLVPLCCVVNPEKESNPIMGNMNKETLIDIWNNAKFWKYRLKLQDGDRTLPGCNNCNAKVAYSHAVRHVE